MTEARGSDWGRTSNGEPRQIRFGTGALRSLTRQTIAPVPFSRAKKGATEYRRALLLGDC
jgi:hypothetical protein